MWLAWRFFTLAASWVGAGFFLRFNKRIWYIRRTPGSGGCISCPAAVLCLSDLLLASLLLTFNGKCRLVFTPVGEALSRLVLGVHLFCVGTVRRDMWSSIWI